MFSSYNAPAMSRSAHVVLLRCALVLAAVAASTPARATTYVPVSDQALIERAVVIGTFEVVSADLAPTARLATEYQMRVETLIKGELRASIVPVRVPGGETRSGDGLRLSGLPSFRPGERGVLLFLVPRRDGAWGIAHVIMGAFHALERSEGDLLVRPNLSEARSIDPRGVRAADGGSTERDRARFLDWIADRVAGHARAADYWVPVEAATLEPRFTQFRDRMDGIAMRWFDFDNGRSVVWRSANQGPAGYPDQGAGAVQAGLAAWSNLTQANIELPYAGLGPIDQGFQDADGVNTVLFDDPHFELEEEFDCSMGGVLAIGGPFYTDQVFRYKSQNWHPIVEGVVILNRNLECFLGGNSVRLAEVLGHEFGHTLGIGHSCGSANSPSCAGNPVFDDALMRATVHNDNRGPRLNSDDMAAGRALYGPQGGAIPRAPTKLTAQLVVDDVTLQWSDRSSNEQGFGVYRRLGAGAFELIGQTAAGVDHLRRPRPRQRHPGATRCARSTQSGDSATQQPGQRDGGQRSARNGVLDDTPFYGSEETGGAVVKLERIGGKSGPLSVRLRTRDLSATAPLDYTARDLRSHLGPHRRPAEAGHDRDRRRLQRRGERADRGPARDRAGRGAEPGLPARHRRRHHRRRRRLARLRVRATASSASSAAGSRSRSSGATNGTASADSATRWSAATRAATSGSSRWRTSS